MLCRNMFSVCSIYNFMTTQEHTSLYTKHFFRVRVSVSVCRVKMPDDEIRTQKTTRDLHRPATRRKDRPSTTTLQLSTAASSIQFSSAPWRVSLATNPFVPLHSGARSSEPFLLRWSIPQKAPFTLECSRTPATRAIATTLITASRRFPTNTALVRTISTVVPLRQWRVQITASWLLIRDCHPATRLNPAMLPNCTL
jgi:hypothetical protein